MRADWNDELRRAYDQGYWDARREFEHILNRSQMGSRMSPGDRGTGPESQQSWIPGGRSEGYGPGNLDRGGSIQAGSWGAHGGPGGDYGRGSDYGPGGGYGRGGDYGRSRYEHGGDYGSGSQHDMEHVGSHNRSERTGDQWYGERNLYAERHGYGEYPPGDRRSAFEHGSGRGFLDRVGDEVRSWFGGDHDDDERRRYGSPDLNDRR